MMQTDDFSSSVSTTGERFVISSLCHFPHWLIVLRGPEMLFINVPLTNPERFATSANDNLKKCI